MRPVLPYPHDSTITVYPPCDCAPCARGDRWFRCARLDGSRPELARYIVPQDEYGCTAWDADAWSSIAAELVASHPGAVFVYV